MALSGNFSTNKYTTSSHGTIGLNLSWTGTQDVANNQTTIKWTLKSNGTMSSGYYVQGGPISAYINGTRVFYQSGRFNVKGDGGYKKTGTIVVNHNEDGSKNVAMSISAALYSTSQNCTGSKTFTLNKINRYAILESAPDFNDEDNPTITYNNYAGELVTDLQACISLDGTTDNIPYRDLNKLGSEYTFNLTSAERNTLLAATPNSNTLTVYFIIKTTIAGSTYYSTLQKTMTVINAAPTITSPAYLDTNSQTTAITLNNQQIIQGISTVSFTFGALTALKSATLSRIDIKINAVTVSDNLSGSSVSSETIPFGVINSSSNLSATVVLTDSRGNTTTLEIPITILSWSLPTAIITVERRNNFYNDTYITVDASISSLDSKNTMLIQYQYKEKSSQNWSALVTIQDNTQAEINAPDGLDNTKDYDIKVIITDRIGSTTYNTTVNKGIPLAMFDKLKSSVGIDCLPSQVNTLEVNGNIKVNNNTSVGGDLSVTGDIGGADITASGSVSAATASVSGNVNAGDVLIDNISVKRVYSTTPRAVGKWINGSIIYEKVIELSAATNFNTNSWVNLESWSDSSQAVDITGINTAAGSAWRCFNAEFTGGYLKAQNTRSTTVSADTFIVRYFNIA